MRPDQLFQPDAAGSVSKMESQKVSSAFKTVLESQNVDLARAIVKNTETGLVKKDSGVRVEVPGHLNIEKAHLKADDLPSRLDVQGDLTIGLSDVEILNGKFIHAGGAIEVIVPESMTQEDRNALENKVLMLNGVSCAEVRVVTSESPKGELPPLVSEAPTLTEPVPVTESIPPSVEETRVRVLPDLEGEKSELVNQSEKLKQILTGLRNIVAGAALPTVTVGLVVGGAPYLAGIVGVTSLMFGGRLMLDSMADGAKKIIDAVKGKKNERTPHVDKEGGTSA